MNKKANVIELNGKRYDAATGKLLDAPSHQLPGRVIDGFVRPSIHTPTTVQHHAPKPVEKSHTTSTGTPAPHHKTLDIRRAVTHHTAPHRPERAKTLMRHAVARPHTSLKRHAKAMSHTGALVKKPRFDIIPKASISVIDAQRFKRAQRIAKSGLITRFGNVVHAAPTPKSVTQPTPTAIQQSTVTFAIPSRQASTELFDRALARANSHTQPHHPTHAKKSHRVRHLTSVATSSLAILLIVGFITYQNAANLQLHVASSRAGISATMPKWQPTGFAAIKFVAAPGSVVVAFKNNDTTQAFSLAQTATNWDSNALLSDFVAQQTNTYSAVESNGRLIYTYGNNNATWVDGGIWYTLTSNGSLSTTQLIRLASST